MSEEMKRDEYGDPIGGPKISKKQMKKNLASNAPDEQHNTRMGESTEITEGDKKGKGSGTKDACYHKVKSRYSVWPSAYASGALVKCRKVGAANWGNSTKKEEYIPEEGYDVARDMGRVRPSKDKKDATSYPPSEEMKKLQKVNKGPSALDRVKKKYKGQIMDVKKEEVELDEKCWKGYEKKGMKTMFGKRYPNCVKKEEYSDWREEIEYLEEIPGVSTVISYAGKMGVKAGAKQIAKRGAKRAAKRAAIKVAGKSGGKAVKKAGKVAARETKKAAVETAGAVGAGAAKGLKKRKERTLEKIKRKSEEMVSGEKKKVKEGKESVKKSINEFIGGGKGDGYLGPTVKIGGKTFGIPNPKPKVDKYITNKSSEVGNQIKDKIVSGADDASKKLTSASTTAASNLSKGVGKAALYGSAAVIGTKLASKAIDRVLPDKKKKKTKKEEYSDWRNDLTEDDMKGMSVKSGHKRPTKSGAGMTQKGVEAYRRRNPGSKLKTAVTTKPSKLKKGSKAANRRKSYCARSAGQMKKFPKAAKDPNSRLRQARRRWNC